MPHRRKIFFSYLVEVTFSTSLSREQLCASSEQAKRREKVRYKWRRRKTLVRFAVLRLDDIWSHWVAVEARETQSPNVLGRRKSQTPTGHEPRRVA